MAPERPGPMVPTQFGGPRADVARLLGLVHRLTLNAFRAPTADALVFRTLNDTVQLFPYSRAAFWSLDGSRPRLVGISGQAQVRVDTELTSAWRDLVAALPDPAHAVCLDPQVLGLPEAAWKTVLGDRPKMEALWVPLPSQAGRRSGLWLERSEGNGWGEDEVGLLGVLAEGYGAAWDRHAGGQTWRRWKQRFARRRTPILAVLAAALTYGLLIHPIHLKVVAPCEVVAKDPTLVTAPLIGVIETLAVDPGQSVQAGELLFRYDPRLPQQELEISRQQVKIVQSQLDRAVVLSLQGKEQEDMLKVLRNRLEQEQARLRLAQYNFDRLEVRAPIAGVVQVSDPHEWKGKPVSVGEKVLTLVDPARTHVRLWLPEDDSVPGIAENEVDVFLNAAPNLSYETRLSFLANSAGLSPEGIPCFVAESDWTGPHDGTALGLKGSAILYGRQVNVLYWVLRRPWAWIRETFGW